MTSQSFVDSSLPGGAEVSLLDRLTRRWRAVREREQQVAQQGERTRRVTRRAQEAVAQAQGIADELNALRAVVEAAKPKPPML